MTPPHLRAGAPAAGGGRYGVAAARALALSAAMLLVVPGSGNAAAAPLFAQDRSSSEPRLLADAERLESSGDLEGAEALLESLLQRYPASSGGLFAYERVLRSQGRAVEVLPAIDALLERDGSFEGARLLKLRILVDADSLDEVRTSVDDWIAFDPLALEPYREAASVLEQAFGPEEALDLLRAGVEQLNGSPLLAIEAGDLLLRTGRSEEAMREWSGALGEEGAQLPAILQRVTSMAPSERGPVRGLVEELAEEPTTPARRRAAVQIAAEVRLEEEAMALAAEVLPSMPESARRGFLAGIARQAEEHGLDRMRLWIYRTIREGSTESAETVALDREIVQLAMAVGDTALAFDAQKRLAAELPEASGERREAAARMVELSLALDSPEEVEGRLERFRESFPGAPELDALSIGLSQLWLARGNRTAALRALQAVGGPASALERAFLALDEPRPDLDRVRRDLEAAVEGLRGAGATEVIQLLSLINRVGDEAALLAGRLAALAHRGEGPEAVSLLERRIEEIAAADRPPLLALGARLASSPPTSSFEEKRVGFLARLVEEHPGSPEAPEAMLQLARHHAAAGEDVDRAAELLETLILTRPNSPVAPDARRELQRLRQRYPGAGEAK